MKRPPVVIAGLSLALLAIAIVALHAGAAGWRAGALADLFAADEIVTGLRAPRVLLSAIIGACLAVAGVTMQTVLQNDLADPYVLGLAGGASAGAVVSLALWPNLSPGPAAAIGAGLAMALVRSLGGRRGHDPGHLVLAGFAVGAVLTSATGLVLILAPAERLLRSTTFWLFGGFGAPSPWLAVLPALLLASAIVILRTRAERMDRLLLGDDTAASLGVDVRTLRRLLIVTAVLLTASAVAVAGLIGFVGLVAPHVARRLVGARHQHLVPVAALFGATLLVGSDVVARTAFSPREIPVGLLTAAVGGPFFLWLLGRRTPWAAS